MKVLHTSDWHLGSVLYSKKERQEEHRFFLNWLLQIIKDNTVDLLIIAGDVFDTSAPSSASQKMYYEFLAQVKDSGCKNVIIVGGNHDSPSFLNAPKEILAAINVKVIGNISENIEDDIIVIRDNNEKPAVIVCGVPFLRERDISRYTEKESYSNRSKKINENIKKHYEDIAQLAENKRKKLKVHIPIIATGHLSVTGGKRYKDDGVRETYIGNIETISSDIFPKTFDYVALGHYHIPSVIKKHIRYSGSPIPMGFEEANQTKNVFIIDFNNEKQVETVEIPTFQKLESVIGDRNFIAERLKKLKTLDTSIWVEIIYQGDEIFSDFTLWANEQIAGSKIEILKLQNRRQLNEVLTKGDTTETLENLTVYDVFDKFLNKNAISDEQKKELKEIYNEIIIALNAEE